MGYALQAKGAGQSAAELPADIVASLISNGFYQSCYDGQMFFDTDHLVAGKSVVQQRHQKTQSWLACRGESLLRCRPYGMRSLKETKAHPSNSPESAGCATGAWRMTRTT